MQRTKEKIGTPWILYISQLRLPPHGSPGGVDPGRQTGCEGGCNFWTRRSGTRGGDLELISDRLWADFEPTLGRLWINFGPTLGRLSVDVEPTLERLWANFGMTLDKHWTNFGPTLRRLWTDSQLCADLEQTLCRFWADEPRPTFAQLWAMLGLLGKIAAGVFFLRKWLSMMASTL